MASVDSSALSTVFGPDGTAAHEAIEGLSELYRETGNIPPVANSHAAWADYRSSGDSSSDTFVHHTYLSLLCRLAAYRFLEPLPSERHLWPVINGDYFAGEGLGNFLGEYFFSWPFFRRSMGIGEDREALEVVGRMMTALQPFDFSNPPLDLLADLLAEISQEYRGESSERAAEKAEEALATLSEEPTRTCVAPDCREGTALARAVSVAVSGRLDGGEDSLDALLGVTGQFLGMSSDPLDAVVSCVAFVFALGDTTKGPHAPVLVPVYLANATKVPEERRDPNGELTYTIEAPGADAAAGGISLPERVATDPLYLDWLLGRLPNYLRGMALRLRAQAEDIALQEVLNAWYNYLTSPKARTPIPDPLTPAAADVMVEAARSLILAYVRGSGPAPLHIARNAPAPLFAARREFDLIMG